MTTLSSERQFRVHGRAAVRKPKPRPVPKAGPVKVVKARPEVLSLAREMTEGRDVHMTVEPDGSIVIRNGGR